MSIEAAPGGAVEVITPMTRHEATEITKRIHRGADTLATLILEAHDRGAWKALDYPSWGKYIAEEFDLSSGHATRLLWQARAVKEIAEVTGIPETQVPLSSRAADELGPEGVADVAEKTAERIADGGASPTERIRILREETLSSRRKAREEREAEDARARASDELDAADREELAEAAHESREVEEALSEGSGPREKYTYAAWDNRPAGETVVQAVKVLQQVLEINPAVLAQAYLELDESRIRIPAEVMGIHLLTWAEQFVAELRA